MNIIKNFYKNKNDLFLLQIKTFQENNRIILMKEIGGTINTIKVDELFLDFY